MKILLLRIKKIKKKKKIKRNNGKRELKTRYDASLVEIKSSNVTMLSF